MSIPRRGSNASAGGDTRPAPANESNENNTLKSPDLRTTNYGTSNRPTANEERSGDEDDYPEGGFHAWLVVFGAWCCMIGGLALLNSQAPLQSYIARNQLSQYSESTVGWIFSIQLFVVFFLGIQVGPLFDALGPRILVGVGTFCLTLSLILLGDCTEYWHFILDFSVLSGLACSLLLTPPLATIGHYFNQRRAFATGMAMTGPSIGGVMLPLVFRASYPRLGFPWACRILGFIILALLIPANIFLRSRFPRRKVTFREVLPDFSIFLDRDGALAFATAGFFLMEFSLFIPLAYLTSYAISAGLSQNFSYNVIAILNAASVVGRALPGFIADRVVSNPAYKPYHETICVDTRSLS
jgi:MFS family permease